MIDLPFPIDQWARPIIIITIVTLFGFAFKIFIHSRLRKAAELSKWEGDDVFISSIESQIVFWFFLMDLHNEFMDNWILVAIFISSKINS